MHAMLSRALLSMTKAAGAGEATTPAALLPMTMEAGCAREALLTGTPTTALAKPVPRKVVTSGGPPRAMARTRKLFRSATSSRALAASSSTSAGLKKEAAMPSPSAKLGEPLPASVVTEPEASAMDLTLWLFWSAT
jgi:hypothetical protein